MGLFVPIDQEAQERLGQLARENRRAPRDQAAVILETALGLRHEEGQPANLLQFVGKDSQQPEEKLEV